MLGKLKDQEKGRGGVHGAPALPLSEEGRPKARGTRGWGAGVPKLSETKSRQ